MLVRQYLGATLLTCLKGPFPIPCLGTVEVGMPMGYFVETETLAELHGQFLPRILLFPALTVSSIAQLTYPLFYHTLHRAPNVEPNVIFMSRHSLGFAK